MFNPEHDLALAANLARFTAPRAGRELRRDLGFLPALWAEEGDLVLVDDVALAENGMKPFAEKMARVRLVTRNDLLMLHRSGEEVSTVDPWGWDVSLVQQLRKCVSDSLLPDNEWLERVRSMSHRRFSSEKFLPVLTALDGRLTGDSCMVESLNGMPYGLPVVLKSPWSSTGRGVRYARDEAGWSHNLTWAERVIAQQGGIMVEPLYNKVCDFAMEFQVESPAEETSSQRQTRYLGLSLFTTERGAYTGNLVATEHQKRARLGSYVDLDLLDSVRDAIVSLADRHIAPAYEGPFGVDMMMVEMDGKVCLHPCVELNLRRTMGHVALMFDPEKHIRQLRIVYEGGRYRLTTTS